MKKSLCFFFLFLFTAALSVQALSWAYMFVVWDGNVYEVTEEAVPRGDIGEKIGEVKRQADKETGAYYGDASNFYPAGTGYYKIKDVSPHSAIAVEAEKNKWLKALYVHKAPFHWMDFLLNTAPFFLMGTVSIFGFWLLSKTKKQRKF